MALPAFLFPHEKFNFLFLGEVQPFCILEQNIPANKARNRPCSISRAERNAHWPKILCNFRAVHLPMVRGEPVIGRLAQFLDSGCEGSNDCAKRPITGSPRTMGRCTAR